MQGGDNTSIIYTPTTMNTGPNFHEQQDHALKCPRCESLNTKFCYYNNYNLSQPRHFCKNCRRYWTKGGTLRNIPIGGGTRKNNKRSSSYSNKRGVYSASANSLVVGPVQAPLHEHEQQQNKNEAAHAGIYGYGRGDDQMEGGSRGGQFAKLLMDGLSPNFVHGSNDDNGLIQNHPHNVGEFEGHFMSMNHKNSDHEGVDDNAWPDLSIYTPGSSFH